MENTQTPISGPSLIFTDAAAMKVSDLIAQEENPALMLRVFISGGGCSGFQYGFTFDENSQDGDVRIERHGVTLLVDPILHVENGTLDAPLFEAILPAASEDLHLKHRVKGFERELFEEALRRADGKKSGAAKLLGIDPSNWAYHAKRLKLQ